MFDYGVCFGGMLRGYASGYASRSVKTKVVAFPEGMLQGMLRGMLRLSRTSQSYINWTPKKKTSPHDVYFNKYRPFIGRLGMLTPLVLLGSNINLPQQASAMSTFSSPASGSRQKKNDVIPGRGSDSFHSLETAQISNANDL